MPHLVLAYQNTTTQKVVEHSLAGENIEVHSFGDGTQALEYTCAEPTDVLLADLAVSGKDGYELCSEVRKNPQTTHIPVVLLGGTFDTFDVERARQCGYTSYLRKPFEASSLVGLIKDLLTQPSQVPSCDSGKSEREGARFHISASGEKGEGIFPLTASQCSPAFRLLARITGIVTDVRRY